MASPALRSEDDLLRLFALTSTLLFFRPVPAPSLLQLARALETAAAAAGQVVVAHGQPGAAMYVILAGSVAPQARRRESRGGGAEGSEGASEAGGQTGAALQAGDAFGEEALLHGDG